MAVSALIVAAIVGSVLAAAGGIGAAGLNYAATKETNELNKEINETNNAFNADEAQKQRDFEAEQSANAVQRRAADLKAAGFNPLLAVTNGAASTPGAVGASASGYIPMKAADFSPLAQISNNLGHVCTSAAYIKRIEHICQNDPKTAAALGKMANQLNSSLSSADKMDKLSSVSAEDIEMSKFLRETNLWK